MPCSSQKRTTCLLHTNRVGSESESPQGKVATSCHAMTSEPLCLMLRKPLHARNNTKKKYLLTSQKKAQKTWLYLVPTSLPCREYIYLQVLLSQRITHIRCKNTMKMQQTDSIQQATSGSFSFADTHKHHLMIHSTLTKPVQQKI